MIEKRPKISSELIRILLKITPGPIGESLSLKQAARDLNIGYDAARYKLKQFEKKYPKAWDNFLKLKKLAKQDKYELRWKRVEKQQIFLKTFTDLAGDNEVSEFLDMLENKGELKGLL